MHRSTNMRTGAKNGFRELASDDQSHTRVEHCSHLKHCPPVAMRLRERERK